MGDYVRKLMSLLMAIKRAIADKRNAKANETSKKENQIDDEKALQRQQACGLWHRGSSHDLCAGLFGVIRLMNPAEWC